MIARIWKGAVAQADREAYARYAEETGLACYLVERDLHVTDHDVYGGDE